MFVVEFPDHTLITPLSIIETAETIWVVNAHLSAGNHAPKRRFQQVHEAMETIRKKKQILGNKYE